MICNDGPVFDVGCATGNLGKALRKQNKNNEIYGLEIDPESRAVALQKNIYKDIAPVSQVDMYKKIFDKKSNFCLLVKIFC